MADDGPHLCKRDPASSFMLIMPARPYLYNQTNDQLLRGVFRCFLVGAWRSSIFGLIGYYRV